MCGRLYSTSRADENKWLYYKYTAWEDSFFPKRKGKLLDQIQVISWIFHRYDMCVIGLRTGLLMLNSLSELLNKSAI